MSASGQYREGFLPFERARLQLVALIDALVADPVPGANSAPLNVDAIALEDYLEIRRGRDAQLASLVAAGRLGLSPWYVTPHEGLVCGESLLRNLAAGGSVGERFGGPQAVRDVAKLMAALRDASADSSTGMHSARIPLKLANARVTALLQRWAEPLSVFAALAGAPRSREELRYAWKILLQNHARRSLGGCAADAVHDESLTRFARAAQVAEAVRDAAAEALARQVPAAADGAWRCLAINPNQDAFAGALEALVDLPPDVAPGMATPVAARTPDGAVVPVQVLSQRARRVRLLWPAQVPALGFAAFDLLFEGAPAATPRASKGVGSAERSAENEFVRLLVNDDGTVDVVDRRTGARHGRCGAFEDGGDAGDLFSYSAPAADLRVTSAHATEVHVSRVAAGPLRAAFRIELVLPLPDGIASDRSSRSPHRVGTRVSMLVSLDAGSPRVVWDVTVENQARDHRLRMLFPAGSESAAEARSDAVFELARTDTAGTALSFVDAGGPGRGATVFTTGLSDYEVYPRDEAGGPRLAVTLLRCVGDLSRDDLPSRPAGHLGPALAVPGAQCLGTHTFRLAFEPRAAEPPAAALFARAAAFANPPLVIAAAGPSGQPGASTGSFIAIDNLRGSAVLSACKAADDRDAVIVRFFNPDDTPATLRVRMPAAPIVRAAMVDPLEQHPQELPVRDGAVEVAVPARGIRTIELG